MMRDYGDGSSKTLVPELEIVDVNAFNSRNRRDGITSRFRLRGYDYSLPGYYFVTICIDDRSHLLGRVMNEEFLPSDAGQMVLDLWMHQVERFPGIHLDALCVMPNHFHALVGLSVLNEAPSRPTSLPEVMQGFKSATTVAYGRGVRSSGWAPYHGRLWQTGYHEHIVRDDRDIERIRDYIESNPSTWQRDTFFT